MKTVSIVAFITCFASPSMKDLEAQVAEQESKIKEKVQELSQQVGDVPPALGGNKPGPYRASLLEELDAPPIHLGDASTQQAFGDLDSFQNNLKSLNTRMKGVLAKLDKHELETEKIAQGSSLVQEKEKALPGLEQDTIETKADTKQLEQLRVQMKSLQDSLRKQVSSLKAAIPASLVEESSSQPMGSMDDVLAETDVTDANLNKVAKDMLAVKKHMAHDLDKLQKVAAEDHTLTLEPAVKEARRSTSVGADGSLEQLRTDEDQ